VNVTELAEWDNGVGADDGTGKAGENCNDDVIAGCVGWGAVVVAGWAVIHGCFNNVAGWELDAAAAHFFDAEFTGIGKGGMLRSHRSSKSSLLCCSQRCHVDWISCSRQNLVLTGPTDARSSQVVLSRIACGAHTALG
jgi:hypothetical protein